MDTPIVDIIDIAEGGKGLAKLDGLTLFVNDAVPGDKVEIEIGRKKKRFADARVLSIKEKSPLRTDSFCNHFGTCGGCKWQHMTYEGQLQFKEKKVLDALQRIGQLEIEEVLPILPAKETTYYRNKLEFTFSNNRWLTGEEISTKEEFDQRVLGFHVPKRFDKVFPIQHCYLQAEPSNEIRNSLYAFAIENDLSFYDLRAHTGLLRNLIIRNSSTGDCMVIVCFGEDDKEGIELVMHHVKATFPQISCLMYVINLKKNDTISDQEVISYSGKDGMMESMKRKDGKELKFKVGPQSFFQTNSKQAEALYQVVADFANLQGTENVYDLYTGAGTIACFLAADAKKVVGIEYVEAAVKDAYVNAELNNIKNVSFRAGDMADVFNEDFIAKEEKADIIICDPPRAGMHPKVVERLLGSFVERIVYVSCNAATQARDLSQMKGTYKIVKSRAVDMFPHTDHIENVVLLERI